MEQKVTTKEIKEYLKKIGEKIDPIYSVYIEEVNFSHYVPYIKQTKEDHKRAKELTNELKLRLCHPAICGEFDFTTTIVETVCELEQKFSKAYSSYEYHTNRTGITPYIKKMEKEKEEFSCYFKTLLEVGNAYDAKKENKGKRTKKSAPAERKA